jgi:hypothetical protein
VLKGSIHIEGSPDPDKSVRIKRGAVLDGTRKHLSLTDGSIVERGITLDGVVTKKKTHFKENVLYRHKEAHIPISHYPSGMEGSAEALRVENVDFSKLGLTVSARTKIWILKRDLPKWPLSVWEWQLYLLL